MKWDDGHFTQLGPRHIKNHHSFPLSRYHCRDHHHPAKSPHQWFLFYRGSIFEQVVTRTGGGDPRQIDAKTSALMRRQSHGMGYKLMLIPAVKLMFNPAWKLCLVDVLKASSDCPPQYWLYLRKLRCWGGTSSQTCYLITSCVTSHRGIFKISSRVVPTLDTQHVIAKVCFTAVVQCWAISMHS